VNEAARVPFARWTDFYVIVGSAAAALTGLQFVVIALMKDFRQQPSEQTISAFGTPTVVHFSIALLTAAILTAPWPALWQASVGLGLCGALSFVYALNVLRRARRQSTYQPVLEDWIWHVVLPLIAYGLLSLSGFTTGRWPTAAPFGVGAAVWLLLFIGIHNSWDTVTYVALTASAASERDGRETGTEDLK
jgi:hypothetical protein